MLRCTSSRPFRCAALLLVLLVVPLGRVTLAQDAANRFPVYQNGEWGYVDEDGNMVIEPQFSEALPFSDGRAVVVLEEWGRDKWGYIDAEGREVIEPTFAGARRFSEGVAPVERQSDEWQYIDAEGDPVFSETYAYAEPFRGPLARVATEANGGGHRHRGGRIQFSGGVADADWIYLDRQGQRVWPPANTSGPAEAPGRTEASRITEVPRTTETPQSTETNASTGGDEGPSATLKALLPEELPGGFVRITVERKNLPGDNPNAAGTYASETDTLEVIVARYRTHWNEALGLHSGRHADDGVHPALGRGSVGHPHDRTDSPRQPHGGDTIATLQPLLISPRPAVPVS